MAKKKVEEAAQSAEDIHVGKESKRLREVAYSRWLLSKEKASPEEPLRPKLGIRRCDGRDICKKGHRKNKYLFSFPGLVATVAGGKFGELAQLDSRNPILYVDFPQGRLKLFGTIVYPKRTYITMNFVRGAGDIQCEDLFESMVVFPEAWWIGTKEANPDELRLEMPLDLQQEKHSVYDFAGGAGEPRDSKENGDVLHTQSKLVQAKHTVASRLTTPKGQLKMDQWLFQKVSSERESHEHDHEFVHLKDAATPSGQTDRTIGENYSYAESPVKEKETDNTGGLAELVAEPLQKDAEECLLVSDSEASKKDASSAARIIAPVMLLAKEVQSVTTASAAGTGSKQSSISTFFMKSSEKRKRVSVDTNVSVENSCQCTGDKSPVERKNRKFEEKDIQLRGQLILVSDDSDTD